MLQSQSFTLTKIEGKCKEFTWGGCDGIVPFDTMEECEKCECSKSN